MNEWIGAAAGIVGSIITAIASVLVYRMKRNRTDESRKEDATVLKVISAVTAKLDEINRAYQEQLREQREAMEAQSEDLRTLEQQVARVETKLTEAASAIDRRLSNLELSKDETLRVLSALGATLSAHEMAAQEHRRASTRLSEQFFDHVAHHPNAS